jgi:hypothetical protein
MHAPLKPTSFDFGQILWRVIVVLLVVYALVTAVDGWRVGSIIATARRNPLVDIGSTMIGRDATERFAIDQLHVPRFIEVSPTFWIALRLSER